MAQRCDIEDSQTRVGQRQRAALDGSAELLQGRLRSVHATLLSALSDTA